nr:Chain C, nonameric peptide chimeric gp100 [synthetic construct]3CH1_F Chain F, nonameric peptide chimeric gp100 [synthetic construct]3CH1_I Chain I, nonameric peptide chimeric gp100 [synthetic construct]3CH1_L Chain L, nonameric peptide chimeric gp100 [synthetic construct]4IHO_C Chain C, NONAMERIC PEPTIDE CHIMERIC GP100 [synthetic construct]4IHO_F Chain F, NONAMERIC PEPTIDE CHIMERIC GP100 [synthetic construct]
EGPRNQDWL